MISTGIGWYSSRDSSTSHDVPPATISPTQPSVKPLSPPPTATPASKLTVHSGSLSFVWRKKLTANAAPLMLVLLLYGFAVNSTMPAMPMGCTNCTSALRATYVPFTLNAAVPEKAGVLKYADSAGSGDQPPACCTAITAEPEPVSTVPSIVA